MNQPISVLLCSRNPRPAYLERTLRALKNQTLPFEEWELLLVDNASSKPLASAVDLSWHPQSRHICESKVGSTAAKLRGIDESSGELLVFVDDDNLIDSNYLSAAKAISQDNPKIGAFGGSSQPEFEKTPSATVARNLNYLAVDEIDRDYWANVLMPSKATPFGAGLCVRRSVALDYSSKVHRDKVRQLLGRFGKSLGGHEDQDLAWCAIDLGMGTARFRQLKLVHLIPAARVDEDYVARLIGAGVGSMMLLEAARGKLPQAAAKKWLETVKFVIKFLLARPFERKILVATRRSVQQARKVLETLGY